MKKITKRKRFQLPNLERVQEKYHVPVTDFTDDYPGGILAYFGSDISPAYFSKESLEEIDRDPFVEDKHDLLQNSSKKKEVNQLTPGYIEGLYSCHFHSEFAARKVLNNFLQRQYEDSQKKLGLTLTAKHILFVNDVCFDQVWRKQPIGYIYGIRVVRALNISANFQWNTLPPEQIEQAIALGDIQSRDILFYRPVYLSLSRNSAEVREFGVSVGELVFISTCKIKLNMATVCENLNVNAQFRPLFDAEDDDQRVTADENLKTYLELSKIGCLHSKNKYSHDQNTKQVSVKLTPFNVKFENQTPDLSDSTFSRKFIVPFIAKTEQKYLKRLKDRYIREGEQKKQCLDEDKPLLPSVNWSASWVKRGFSLDSDDLQTISEFEKAYKF